MEVNTMPPLLSVIVPVYNAGDYLKKCIDSILEQTYEHIEVILVDDGSTDGSGSICNEYMKQDNRVRVYHKENGGQASARNYGLNVLTGGYITFVDDDDWIEPTMYEELMAIAIEHETEITGCATMTEYADGTQRNYYLGIGSGIISAKTCIGNMLYGTQAWGFVWNKIFKAELFETVRFPEGKQLEDYLVMVRLFNEAKSIYFLQKGLYHYNSREGTQSKRKWYPGKLTIIESAEAIKNYCLSNCADKSIEGGAYRFTFGMYASVFWDIYMVKPEGWRQIISEQSKNSREALKQYLRHSKKQKGDLKLICKYWLAVLGIPM